jgi:hypothetical protein
MNYWLAQLVLAARRSSDRDSGWMQILVVAVLAIFYAVGSIVKARANKTAPKGKEQAPRKPVRKSPEEFIDLRMLKQLFGIPEEAESSSQPSPEASKPKIAKQQVQPTVRKVARPQPTEGRKVPIETSKIMLMEPQVQPKLEKVPGLTGEAEVPTEIPQAKYLSDILSDYEDPERLRRAILHYEILGKPLSLREPSEHTIGF